MNSIILTAAARLIAPIIFVVSLILLYQGHSLPGGGFIGGLIAATAILLKDFANSRAAKKLPEMVKVGPDDESKPMPVVLMIIGLGVAGCSALLPVFFGDPFFMGYWLPTFSLPGLGAIHLGTPLIFDVGVYLTVIGFVVHSARCLKIESESDEEKEEAWN